MSLGKSEPYPACRWFFSGYNMSTAIYEKSYQQKIAL